MGLLLQRNTYQDAYIEPHSKDTLAKHSLGRRYSIVPIIEEFAGKKVVLPIPAPSLTTAT